MTLAFVWVCWNFIHAPQTQLASLSLPVIGSLAICLLASTAAVKLFLAVMFVSNAQLAKERDLLHTIIDNLPDYIYAKDKQGRFVLNNPAHAAFGCWPRPERWWEKAISIFSPANWRSSFMRMNKQCIATGESVINQEQYKLSPGDKSGKKRRSFISKVIWRDKDGNILGTVGISR